MVVEESVIISGCVEFLIFGMVTGLSVFFLMGVFAFNSLKRTLDC